MLQCVFIFLRQEVILHQTKTCQNYNPSKANQILNDRVFLCLCRWRCSTYNQLVSMTDSLEESLMRDSTQHAHQMKADTSILSKGRTLSISLQTLKWRMIQWQILSYCKGNRGVKDLRQIEFQVIISTPFWQANCPGQNDILLQSPLFAAGHAIQLVFSRASFKALILTFCLSDGNIWETF